jgi:hypothetical protein
MPDNGPMQFEPAVLEAAARQREVTVTTRGRKTGRAHTVITWISTDASRLFLRSGGGLGRDWTRNVLADDGLAVLSLGDAEVRVRATHIVEPATARLVTGLLRRKYGDGVQGSAEGEELTVGERATFELFPA